MYVCKTHLHVVNIVNSSDQTVFTDSDFCRIFLCLNWFYFSFSRPSWYLWTHECTLTVWCLLVSCKLDSGSESD